MANVHVTLTAKLSRKEHAVVVVEGPTATQVAKEAKSAIDVLKKKR